MIRIPGTKIEFGWGIPVLLLGFMLLSDSWLRGLLSFVLLLGIWWLIGAVLWSPLVWLMYANKRRPDESLRQLSRRMTQELNKYSALSRGRRSGRSGPERQYWYVGLNCGHVVFDSFPGGLPSVDDTFWCWGHRRFGPAQEQVVTNVHQFLPEGID
jgi:hypothetical protein